MDRRIVGIIGAGSFGMALANIVSTNADVYIYARREEAIQDIQNLVDKGEIHKGITPTSDIEEICEKCHLLFPVVPSAEFRNMIKQFAPFLRPDHVLIHGTKGLDQIMDDGPVQDRLSTMSQVITQETAVLRTGCVAGPNLARELNDGQPAATVIASRFEEVISLGKRVLRSPFFQVYGSHDIRGIEWAGILKNYIAIAAGALNGLGYGQNAQSLLLTRGMAEMIYIGKAINTSARAFLGVAGIGDLVATCNSNLSRNFTVGYQLAKGKSIDEIVEGMNEVAEGIRTIKMVKELSESLVITAPIVHTLYRVIFESLPLDRGLRFLMRYPALLDAEYIDLVESSKD